MFQGSRESLELHKIFISVGQARVFLLTLETAHTCGMLLEAIICKRDLMALMTASKNSSSLGISKE